MPGEFWAALPSLTVILLGGGVSILVAVLNRGGARENALIDQLQEQVTAQAARQEASDLKLDAALRRERIRDNYIHELRDHIEQRKNPPPPPWPEGLTR